MSDSHKGATAAASGQDDADSDDGPLGRFGEWRESVRARPHAYRLYRIAIGVLGGLIVLGGLALVPLPGPGWIIVFVGLAVLATEFEKAHRLERFARNKVHAWTEWLTRQPLAVRLLAGLLTFAFVLGVFYLALWYYGVPEFVPETWTSWIPGPVG